MEEIRFSVICEYSPTGDTFQVVELRHESGADYTFLVSAADRFSSFADLAQHLAARLGVDAEEIQLEEV